MANLVQDFQKLFAERQQNRLLHLTFPHNDSPYSALRVNRLTRTESLSRDFEFKIECVQARQDRRFCCLLRSNNRPLAALPAASHEQPFVSGRGSAHADRDVAARLAGIKLETDRTQTRADALKAAKTAVQAGTKADANVVIYELDVDALENAGKINQGGQIARHR